MIQHFQYKKMYESDLPGWTFSFTYQGEQIRGIYHKNGQIEWSTPSPVKDPDKVEKQIHDLMLFHVYGD
ncbi:DUF5342 family protein [Jeotgalibacillus sp. R-1-5s-1]|uniref:DUF5342 family protein n=1 Tax=Jeotgalibacillus sp. R-1-5s-1 TaxID=2555897 RepID=UPI001069742F|nr:DUF5342 family protein [Jeotgalibacillus sp. R-1-5s-1]TFD97674.1 hypothetical protein E2491_09650 [Jeotgalibacillus sp. R-1-5s-1]